MFSPKGLFHNLPCPKISADGICSRNPCPFSHKPVAQLTIVPSPLSTLLSTRLAIRSQAAENASSKINTPASTSKLIPKSSLDAAESDQAGWTTVARKRQAAETSSPTRQAQPPEKVQRLDSNANKKATSSTPISTSVSGSLTLTASYEY